MWVQWIPLFAVILLVLARVLVNLEDRPGTE